MSDRVAVIGYGVTGRAVASWLVGRGDDVIVLDDRADAASGGAPDGVRVEPVPGEDTALADRLAGVARIVPSPGVPVGHPVYRTAERLAIPVVSEIELASEVCRAAGRPRLVAITGTNGKTTVTTLVAAVLAASGLDAVAAGNIGLPLIEAVQGSAEVAVAEVSSFQLQFTAGFRPAVGCWLNLAPDHLDWHPDMEHYAKAKARVWAAQGPGDTAVFNADDPAVSARATAIPAGVARVSYSTVGPADFCLRSRSLAGPDGPFMDLDELPRALPHDVSNSLAAAAVAVSAGAPTDACRSALMATSPLPHRVSLVGSADGVSWYDDSKATTPASVLAAVAGFTSVVLIAGGRNKGLDLSVLAGAVPPVRAAVGIGDAAGEVTAALGHLVPTTTAASMAEAVDHAAAAARPGDAVLLSPGCASFDWYRSYAARGDDFAAIVRQRLERQELEQGGAQC